MSRPVALPRRPPASRSRPARRQIRSDAGRPSATLPRSIVGLGAHERSLVDTTARALVASCATDGDDADAAARAVQYGRLVREVGGSLCDALELLLSLTWILGPDDPSDRLLLAVAAGYMGLSTDICHVG